MVGPNNIVDEGDFLLLLAMVYHENLQRLGWDIDARGRNMFCECSNGRGAENSGDSSLSCPPWPFPLLGP